MAILQLGCGMTPDPAAIRHDRTRHHPWVDVAHDLELLPWPWPDGVFLHVYAHDVMEHLALPVANWLKECHRILAPGGRLHLHVPWGRGCNMWLDPTHVRGFELQSFDYFDPDTWHGQQYGRVYWPNGPWWHIIQRESEGHDLRFVLEKRS